MTVVRPRLETRLLGWRLDRSFRAKWLSVRGRYSDGALARARAAAEVAADAYLYFGRLFAPVEPDIAVVVADERDWPDPGPPYGLPFFRDDAGEIRPGIVVMPAGAGDFWIGMAEDIHEASPRGYAGCARHTQTARVAWTFSRSLT